MMSSDDEKRKETDRISELPDELKHTILSLLPSTKDVIRTSVLSKSWHQVCSAVPDFSWQVPSRWDRPDGNINLAQILGFFTFVHNSLLRPRQLRMPMPGFRLSMRHDYCKLYPKKITDSILDRCRQLLELDLELLMQQEDDVNVNTNIKELDVAFDCIGRYHFPPTIFCFNDSLTILRLTGCKLQLPAESSKWLWPSLRELSLKDVSFDHCFIDNLIFACPSLENLALLRCPTAFNLTLQPPAFTKLETLKIKLLDPPLHRIDVRVPSLQSLSLHVPDFDHPLFHLDFTSCKNLVFLKLKGRPEQNKDQHCQDLISKFLAQKTFVLRT